MSAPLTNIADRKTPSVPIELTFGSQPVATGRKFTNLFAHMAASPGTGTPYQVYTVINVGDPVAAQLEVDALAGLGSQAGKMAAAFVNANAAAGNSNFPAFRVVFLPFAETSFGPNNEAINAVNLLRGDMLVSCYPAGDATNRAKLLALQVQISGIDRDLSGQFGSFATFGSIDALSVQLLYDINNAGGIVAALPDSNTAAVAGVTGSTTSGSNQLTAIARAALSPTGATTASSTSITGLSSVAGIYPGAAITGAGIPANTIVETIVGSTGLIISNPATATASGVSFSIVNLPTAGIYPGAAVSGMGIPANSFVLDVNAGVIFLSNEATATGSAIALAVQNNVSQAPEIVASGHAAGMMSSAFPYYPLNGIVVGGLIPPQIASDRIVIDPNGSSEAALQAGLSPLVVQAAGTVAFLRTVTTWVLEPDDVTPVTAYFDWQDLVTLNDFKEDVFLITQNPPFNNNPGGSKASQMIANFLKDEMLREAFDYEAQDAFQGVKTLAPLFEVEPSQTRGRLDFFMPVNVVPGLMVIAGNLQASTMGQFTL
jgi:hypothetical protein